MQIVEILLDKYDFSEFLKKFGYAIQIFHNNLRKDDDIDILWWGISNSY